MRLVVKYGGPSLSGAGRVRGAAEHAASLAAEHQVVVVCSATPGTTDDLMAVAGRARAGDREGAARLVAGIGEAHARLAREAVPGPGARELLGGIESDVSELGALADGMALLGEATPRSVDYLASFGERLSSAIVSAAIAGAGRESSALTGKEAGIVTDSNFGQSRPLLDTTRLRVSKALGAPLDGGAVPVVCGYAGADQHGRVTTLGRGGSDYSATIIGSCAGADEVWLMGDVEGLMTADPGIVGDARLIREVSYAEAVEMSMFGAKQIHPRTFEPLLARGIPLRIRSSLDTGSEGTLVRAAVPGPAGNTVKCVSSVRGSGLVDIQGDGMVGEPGTAGRIFGTLAGAGINVMMISQNPSESSITIVVKNADLDRAVSALEMGLLGRVIRRLDVTTDVAIVALIGSGMRGTVGVASRVFGAVERRGVNVSMITQGSSELNLAFVVRNRDADAAVRALHEAFGLGGAKSFKGARPGRAR